MRRILLFLIVPLLIAFAQPLRAVAGTPVTGKTIALDAGHGGADPGAVNENPEHRLFEKDMDRAVVELLKEKLEADGARVVLTRNGDETVGLHERVARANAAHADVLISVHHNSANPAVNGTESYFSQPDDRKVAAAMQRRIVEAFQIQDRGVKHMPNFVLTNRPNMPSAITEGSFVTNDAEAHTWRFGGRVEGEATALHKGIIDYFAS